MILTGNTFDLWCANKAVRASAYRLMPDNFARCPRCTRVPDSTRIDTEGVITSCIVWAFRVVGASVCERWTGGWS